MSTILLDMRRTHIPVLAGELIDLLDPRPGQTAIDCTFGGGGHAELIAGRLGAEGTLIGIDRDPLAAERFEELAGEVACSVRFIHASYADALEQLVEEGVQRRHRSYFDLGMSSMQIDTRERGFSYSYEAPLDMRMDPEQELSAREIVAEWDERRLARALRDFGEERHAGADRPRDRAPRAQRPRSRRRVELVDTINSAIPAPARFAGGHPAKRVLPGAADRRQRRARPARPRPAARAGSCCARAVCSPVISFHSLEDRRVKRFLTERARGCICPPEMPVCGCGARPRRRCLHAARSCPPPARSRTIRARARPGCGRRASSVQRTPTRGPYDTTGRKRRRRGAGDPSAAHYRPAASARDAQAAASLRPRSRADGIDTSPRHACGRGRCAPPGRGGGRNAAAARPADPRKGVDRVIALALIGIVTMQLVLLKLNAGIGRSLVREALLQRENATLSAENSEEAAGEQIEAQAARDGMELIPAAGRCAS